MKSIKTALVVSWEWLVYSSANPDKLALTVRGFLLGIVPIMLYVGPMFGFNFDATQWGGIVEIVKQVVEVGLGIVAGCVTIFGLVRKIYLTIKGV